MAKCAGIGRSSLFVNAAGAGTRPDDFAVAIVKEFAINFVLNTGPCNDERASVKRRMSISDSDPSMVFRDGMQVPLFAPSLLGIKLAALIRSIYYVERRLVIGNEAKKRRTPGYILEFRPRWRRRSFHVWCRCRVVYLWPTCNSCLVVIHL